MSQRRTDNDMDGVVTFIINPDPDGVVVVCKMKEGHPVYNRHEPTGGDNFGDLVPAEVPGFYDGNPGPTGADLVTVVDVSTFLAGPNPFSDGDNVPVTSGAIAGEPEFTLRDASGTLPADAEDAALALLDAGFVSSLPLYTGTAVVIPVSQYLPAVPTLGTWALIVLSLALVVTGVLLLRRRAGGAEMPAVT